MVQQLRAETAARGELL
jgi:hypothetical protein